MKTLYKLIIWPLVIIFLSQNIAWTAPLNSPQSIVHSPQSLINIHIPEQYGRIDKSMDCGPWTMDSKSPTVILIKDAHCNYEAQVNISKILDILIRDYKINFVGVEGAAGHVNPQVVLESNPKEDIRKKVSDKFLRTGLLTASEALSINKGKEPGFTIWGIEDLRLYLKDYQAFRDTIGISSSGIHFTEITSKLISQLKEKIYPEELQKFDNIIKKYQSNELPLTRFIKIVYCKYGVPRQHQNLKIVLKSMRLEEKIDFGKVEQERTTLIKQSEKTLPKEDLQELIKQSLLFKLGKIPAVEYYTYLEQLPVQPAISLKNYIRLVKLQSRIDESNLFNELEDLIEGIYIKLCTNKASLDLHQLDKDINILTKIFRLEATREDLSYFGENQTRFTPEKLLEFIKIQAPLNNITLAPELNTPSFTEDVRKSIIPAGEFYKLAIERDTALVENLIQIMDRNKKDRAILVCGGFHADGIKKLLQDKGLSPITITPKITKIQEDARELYLKRMLDSRINPDEISKQLGLENLQANLATGPIGRMFRLPERVEKEIRGLSPKTKLKDEYTLEELLRLWDSLPPEAKNASLESFIEKAKRENAQQTPSQQPLGSGGETLDKASGQEIKLAGISFSGIEDPGIRCEIINEKQIQLINGAGRLNVQVFPYDEQGRNFIRIGSRIYEANPGITTISLIDILSDPLLWLGNAELVNFFGESSIQYPEKPKEKGPIIPVEWTEKLKKTPPELVEVYKRIKEDINDEIVTYAYQQIKREDIDPILKAHYSLIIYFFSISLNHEIPATCFDVVSNINERVVNEFIYHLLGADNVITSRIVNAQFRKFEFLLRRVITLCKAEDKKVDKLKRIPEKIKDINLQNIIIGKISSALSQLGYKDIDKFKSIKDINEKFKKLTGIDVDLFVPDPKTGTLFINVEKLAVEKRGEARRMRLSVFKKRARPFMDMDTVVVHTLAHLCKTQPANVVNRIVNASGSWQLKWTVDTILQGVASNPDVELESPQEEFLRSLILGVGRGGFGLGGASIETETWLRDVFTKFLDEMRVIIGMDKDGKPYIAPQVYFGPKVDKDKHCTAEPLIDAYTYKKLREAIFGTEPLTDGDIYNLWSKVPDKDKPLEVKEKQLSPGEHPEYTQYIQMLYDHYVKKTEAALEKWIIDNNLKVVMFGQAILPDENPILYPALLHALEKINRGRDKKNHVTAFLRHNYFRKKMSPRPGVKIRMIQRDDPIQVFVESETNAEMFEEYFGFRPGILYEAVHFPTKEIDSEKPIRQQIREQLRRDKYSYGEDPVEKFLEKAQAQGLTVQDLENDIIITQPSRIDMNKRPDSTILLAKNIQRMENEMAEKERRTPRKVRILFLGTTVRKGPKGESEVSGTEKEAFDLICKLAKKRKKGDIDISSQIYFLGYVPQKEVIAALTYTHIMSQASDRETFGRTPIEAVATGVPLIYCRNWTYPFDPENRQVFYALFEGLRTITLRPGRLRKDGKWIVGEKQPVASKGEISAVHRMMYHILCNPKEMEQIARSNFYLARRSMFNLKNLENFMKLLFLSYFDPERERLKFKDKKGPKDRESSKEEVSHSGTQKGYVTGADTAARITEAQIVRGAIRDTDYESINSEVLINGGKVDTVSFRYHPTWLKLTQEAKKYGIDLYAVGGIVRRGLNKNGNAPFEGTIDIDVFGRDKKGKPKEIPPKVQRKLCKILKDDNLDLEISLVGDFDPNMPSISLNKIIFRLELDSNGQPVRGILIVNNEKNWIESMDRVISVEREFLTEHGKADGKLDQQKVIYFIIRIIKALRETNEYKLSPETIKYLEEAKVPQDIIDILEDNSIDHKQFARTIMVLLNKLADGGSFFAIDLLHGIQQQLPIIFKEADIKSPGSDAMSEDSNEKPPTGSRGFDGLPNDKHTEDIKKALRNNDFALVGFNQNLNPYQAQFTFDGTLDNRIDTVSVTDQKHRLTDAQLRVLNKAIDKLNPGHRAILQGITILFIPNQKAHYGITRSQIYLDLNLLQPGNELESFLKLRHELVEREKAIQAVQHVDSWAAKYRDPIHPLNKQVTESILRAAQDAHEELEIMEGRRGLDILKDMLKSIISDRDWTRIGDLAAKSPFDQLSLYIILMEFLNQDIANKDILVFGTEIFLRFSASLEELEGYICKINKLIATAGYYCNFGLFFSVLSKTKDKEPFVQVFDAISNFYSRLYELLGENEDLKYNDLINSCTNYIYFEITVTPEGEKTRVLSSDAPDKINSMADFIIDTLKASIHASAKYYKEEIASGGVSKDIDIYVAAKNVRYIIESCIQFRHNLKDIDIARAMHYLKDIVLFLNERFGYVYDESYGADFCITRIFYNSGDIKELETNINNLKRIVTTALGEDRERGNIQSQLSWAGHTIDSVKAKGKRSWTEYFSALTILIETLGTKKAFRLLQEMSIESLELICSDEFMKFKDKLQSEFGENLYKALLFILLMNPDILQLALSRDFISTIKGNARRYIKIDLNSIDIDKITDHLLRFLSQPQSAIEEASRFLKEYLNIDIEAYINEGKFSLLNSWIIFISSLDSESKTKLIEQLGVLGQDAKIKYITILSTVSKSDNELIQMMLSVDNGILAKKWQANLTILELLFNVYKRLSILKLGTGEKLGLCKAIAIAGQRSIVNDLDCFLETLSRYRGVLKEEKIELIRVYIIKCKDKLNLGATKRKEIEKNLEWLRLLNSSLLYLTAFIQVGNSLYNPIIKESYDRHLSEIFEIFKGEITEESVKRIETARDNFFKKLLAGFTGLDESQIPSHIYNDKAVMSRLITIISTCYAIAGHTKYGKVAEKMKRTLRLYIQNGADEKKIREIILGTEEVTDESRDLGFDRNKSEIEGLTGVGPSGERLYDRRLFTKGIDIRRIIQSVSDETRARIVSQQINRIAQDLIPIAREIGYCPEGVDLDEYVFKDEETVEEFIEGMKDKLNTGQKTIVEDVRRNIKQIIENAQSKQSSTAEEVRIVIRKDLLDEAYAGVGVPGCFDPVTGCNKQQPLVHALEANAFFVRIYNGTGQMFANAVICLTDKGIIIYASYSSRTDIDMDQIWLETWKELSKYTGDLPIILIERKNSAGVGLARLYGQRASIEALKRDTVWGFNTYYDFYSGIDENGDVKYSESDAILITKESLGVTEELPKEGVEEAGAEEKAQQEKPERKVAIDKERRREITKRLFEMGLDIELGSVLSNLDSIIAGEVELDSIIDSLKKRTKRDESASPDDLERLRDALVEIMGSATLKAPGGSEKADEESKLGLTKDTNKIFKALFGEKFVNSYKYKIFIGPISEESAFRILLPLAGLGLVLSLGISPLLATVGILFSGFLFYIRHPPSDRKTALFISSVNSGIAISLFTLSVELLTNTAVTSILAFLLPVIVHIIKNAESIFITESRKISRGQFDERDPLHRLLDYWGLEKQFRSRNANPPNRGEVSERYNKAIRENEQLDRAPDLATSTKHRAELIYLAWEAFRLEQFIDDVKNQADKINRPVVIVENLSYGRIALAPIRKRLENGGIQVWSAKVGSSEAHDNPDILVPDLFTDEQLEYLIRESPVVVVVDGSNSLDPLTRQVFQRKEPRWPDGLLLGYSNYFAWLTQVLSGMQSTEEDLIDRFNLPYPLGMRAENEIGIFRDDYEELKGKILKITKKLRTEGIDIAYKVHYWTPSALDLRRTVNESPDPRDPDIESKRVLREVDRRYDLRGKDIGREITGPSLILVQSGIEDELVPQEMRRLARQPSTRHGPCHFDDTGLMHPFSYVLTPYGSRLTGINRHFVESIYPAIESIMKGTVNRRIETDYPFKMILFDLDATLADVMEPIQDYMLEELVKILSEGVQIGIITLQGLEELKKNVIQPLRSYIGRNGKNMNILCNLHLFPSGGAEGFGFNANGRLTNPYYSIGFESDDQRRNINDVIDTLIAGTEIKKVDRNQIIMLHDVPRKKYEELMDNLSQQLKRSGIYVIVEEFGRHTIAIRLPFVTKELARNYMLARFSSVSPEEIFVAGDNLFPDGPDFGMYVQGAHNFRVGDEIDTLILLKGVAADRRRPSLSVEILPFRRTRPLEEYLEEYFPAVAAALKAPGSIGLDEDRGAKEYIEGIVNNKDNIAETIQEKNATIHTIKLGDKLGIPRFSGAAKPQDLVYAFGRKESDGKLHIYVTTAFWEILQENQLMLSFLTDHEYRENIMGMSHAEASKRAWEFVDPDGMNPFYKFYLEQLADNGEEDELKRLVLSEEHGDKYGLRFKQYARKLLLGKRCISEIGIINELLKNDEGKTPGITNLYASHNIGAKVVVDTFSNLGEEINTFFNSERENGLNISREEINIQELLNIMNNMRKALQGEDVIISEDDWGKYTRFNDAKAGEIDFSGADVVILHDHEFLGMVPYLKKMGKKVIWHCHLDLDNFNPDVWDRLRKYVNQCDLVILQPRDKYENIYKTLGITTPAVFAPPATIDPTSNKHRQLDEAEEKQIKDSLNIENLETTPYFLYTGRLDPQKGIMDMIRAFKEMYANLPEGQRAKLIIVSTPEDKKTSYHEEIEGYIQGLKDSGTRGIEDIHRLFLRPDDASTDITINYLQRNALSGLQLSSREGFGLPVAEMMYKGRPVIGTDVGGIKTQIRHALTGYLVKPDSQLVENTAGYMTKLVLDRVEAERLGMKAKELASGSYLASNLVLNYLTAVYSVLKNVAKPMVAMSIPKFLAHTKNINIFDAVDKLEHEINKLSKELERPGISDEQREQILKAIGNIMEYFEAIEHTIYDMFTSGGRASFLVLERLKNIFWKLYRENNWSTPVDVLCINLPVGAINTRAGMETADALKERFFEVVKKYMKEKKKEGILRYEKVFSGYYGIGKTQMYIIGLGAEDIPEIEKLYEEALMAVGIYKTEDFPIYIGHKRASLKGHKRQIEKLKFGEKGKYLENLVIDTMQEALGMAEFIEKRWRISNKYSLSSGDWIMRVPGIRKVVRRLGRKKFIPENEYETNRLPRIRHTLGFLSIKRKSILSDRPRNVDAAPYVNNLKGILLKSLKDVRYRGTYKREYIDGVVEQMKKMKKDDPSPTFWDLTIGKTVMTRAGDEMWFYMKTDKGIESFFGELNKFNAFNDAYEPDSADSFYHQIIKWLKVNMPEIYKFYKKLYEDPSSITLDDIAKFDQLTKFLKQISCGKDEDSYDEDKVFTILQNPQDERRAGLIEKIKSINVIKYVDIGIPDAPPYNSRKGHTPYTEPARVKGKWFKVKLVKSKPLATIKRKSGKRKEIGELPFHSSDKLKIDGKIHRLKLYVMKGKKGEIIRRFVVHNYRIYTADGKGQDDEEDITDSVLLHRDEYEFEPDVTTLGVTLTFDRANLLNLRGDFDESNAYQKKYMHALVSDVSENTANQIISIIKEKYNPDISISQSDLAKTIIQSSKGTYNVDFMKLWELLEERGVPKDKFFEIAVSLSKPINDLLGPEARSKGGLVISAVLREILKSLPAAEREIIVKEQKTPEEQLLETLKHIAKKKGIDPNAIQSIFDLFKGGIDISTMDPGLLDGKIDGSYFTLIQQLCELTGISEGAIMNAFKDNFGRNFRITQGKIIPHSILWEEAQKLMEYNRKYTGDYPLAGVNTDLWDSDFHSGRVIDKAENMRNLFLSELDAVSKDVKAINSALRETPAKNTVESRDPVGVIYHINDYIKYDKKTGTFSFRPGAESIIRQMGEGINIVFTTEDVPKDELMFYKQALKATERFDKSIFTANTLEEAHNLLINKGIDKAEGRIVYVTKTEQNAIKARKLGIKSIIAEEVEGVFAFHATLIFAVLYARARPNEVKTLIWHFLKLMGYKDDEINKVISDLKKQGFFTVRLIRIADTLREFQNRKIFIDVAA